MSLGSRLKDRRLQLGMSRQELADRLGVTATAIGNYELDYSSPKIEILYKIFDVLNCDANYLYQDDISDSLVLGDDEEELVGCYRQLGRENKEKLLGVARYLKESEDMDGLVEVATRKSQDAVS